ncbi:hypothetical protein KHA94_05250 [Bacillus sp. FJAT-49705]|uniref:EXS domain-containing protein n=1 Tax=Cytobacillus citreus TaxID=2833586 RepID=A0ABS5NP75_9BACI|nr:hypothetical protein [Cytobacillus citreus]MBS4189617.1 hypothetical protein [Cytobacillus citreus]
MLDFLLDVSNIPTEYTIYASFMLSLIVKFLWVWNIEYHFINSLNDTNNIDSFAINPLLQMQTYLQRNPLLNWIVKCVRKKVGPGDDPDSRYSFL